MTVASGIVCAHGLSTCSVCLLSVASHVTPLLLGYLVFTCIAASPGAASESEASSGLGVREEQRLASADAWKGWAFVEMHGVSGEEARGLGPRGLGALHPGATCHHSAFCVGLLCSHEQAHFSVPRPKRESGWLSHQRLSLCGPLGGHLSV